MMRVLFKFRHCLLLAAFIPFAIVTWQTPNETGDAADMWLAAKTQVPLLAADSNMHLLFAAASLAVFFTAAILLLDREKERPSTLLATALFTSTVGVLLLVTLQHLAKNSTHEQASGDRDRVLIHYLLQGIAYSYQGINQNDGSFVLQVIAYIFSVGLCEEITKLLPVLYRARHEGLAEADARVLGFMSGVGFGVAEGILYSHTQYNGAAGAITYEVRFLSVVAMHALATATAAGWVVRYHVARQSGWGYFVKLVWVILPVMALHALYDTFCSRNQLQWALATDVILFGLLAHQIDTQEMRGSRRQLRAA
jgi:RsiW-degrading membrane proteinase PrsW (M82 family)